MSANNDEIYNRQARIPNWDQDKLKNTRVLMVGSSILAQQSLVNLAGLGTEEILILSEERIKLDDYDNFLYKKPDVAISGDYKIDHIAQALMQMNNNLNLTLRHGRFQEAWLQDFEPDIIVETTNKPGSKRELLAYANKKGIQFISGSSKDNEGLLTTFDPSKNKASRILADSKGLEEIIGRCFAGHRQDIESSGVTAGLIGDEVRKRRMPLEDKDTPPDKRTDSVIPSGQMLYYNALARNRCSPEINVRKIPYKVLRDFNALVIGGGAIGNTVVAELALRGFGNIDIIDGDNINLHNLSRQHAFRGYQSTDSEKHMKADVLAMRAMEYSNITKAHSMTRMFTEADEKLFAEGNGNGRYDIVFGAVDKLEVRQIINDFARKHKVKFVDGGTSYLAGQASIYVPGVNRCLDCQIDYKEQIERRGAKIQADLDAHGCEQAAPSVIIPNFIIGSAMVAEGIRSLYTKDILDGRFAYRTFRKDRIGVDQIIYRKDCGKCGGN